MAEQARFLREKGFVVGQVYCYPTLATKEEFDRAVQMIFDYCIEGWWHYEDSNIYVKRELLIRRKQRWEKELKDLNEKLKEIEKKIEAKKNETNDSK